MLRLAEANFSRTSRPARRAFTLIELCLGMLITVLVTGALAAFMLTVSRHWQSGDGTQSAVLSAGQATLRLQKRLLDAKRIGYWRAGSDDEPAALAYWRIDGNGDNAMQSSELGVIRFNPAEQAIELLTADLSGGEPDDTWSGDDFRSKAAVEAIGIVIPATTVPLIGGVSSATFSVQRDASTTMAPTAQFTLALNQPDGTTLSETCIATLRGPASPAP
jgi:hypothetical protein